MSSRSSVSGNLGKQALEAEPSLGGGATVVLALIHDDDAVRGLGGFHGPVGEGVLALRGLRVQVDLLRGGLADVDHGEPVEVPGLDLGGARPAADLRSLNVGGAP